MYKIINFILIVMIVFFPNIDVTQFFQGNPLCVSPPDGSTL